MAIVPHSLYSAAVPFFHSENSPTFPPPGKWWTYLPPYLPTYLLTYLPTYLLTYLPTLYEPHCSKEVDKLAELGNGKEGLAGLTPLRLCVSGRGCWGLWWWICRDIVWLLLLYDVTSHGSYLDLRHLLRCGKLDVGDRPAGGLVSTRWNFGNFLKGYGSRSGARFSLALRR